MQVLTNSQIQLKVFQDFVQNKIDYLFWPKGCEPSSYKDLEKEHYELSIQKQLVQKATYMQIKMSQTDAVNDTKSM